MIGKYIIALTMRATLSIYHVSSSIFGCAEKAFLYLMSLLMSIFSGCSRQTVLTAFNETAIRIACLLYYLNMRNTYCRNRCDATVPALVWIIHYWCQEWSHFKDIEIATRSTVYIQHSDTIHSTPSAPTLRASFRWWIGIHNSCCKAYAGS